VQQRAISTDVEKLWKWYLRVALRFVIYRFCRSCIKISAGFLVSGNKRRMGMGPLRLSPRHREMILLEPAVRGKRKFRQNLAICAQLFHRISTAPNGCFMTSQETMTALKKAGKYWKIGRYQL